MRNHPGHALETGDGPHRESAAGIVIRQAQLADVPAMLRLVNGYADQELMLPRTEVEICERIRDFVVAMDENEVVACGAIQFYSPHMAELRSLAVSPGRAHGGVGQRIAREILDQAREVGVEVVFAFTYVPLFFSKLGFQNIQREELPLKAWRDCLRCPKFNACDEVAMACYLTPDAEKHISKQPPSEAFAEGPLVMPTVGKPRVIDQ